MNDHDYDRIAEAIGYLETHFQDQPDLATVAAHVGLSEYHFQRLFRRWAGISPKRFLQFLTAEHAQQLLRESRNTLDASHAVGLSGTSRLHDLTVNVYAMTPGEIQAEGAGLTIRYGIPATPFGDCLVATTPRGVCWLTFVEDGERDSAVAQLRDAWPEATILSDPTATAPIAERIFAREGSDQPLTLLLSGTNFQIRVWEALLRVPLGRVTSYGDLAHAIGSPKAARAVGSAVGQNHLAYLIPCHRVIRQSGAFGNYRWGATRKKAMLGWEMAQTEEDVATNFTD